MSSHGKLPVGATLRPVEEDRPHEYIIGQRPVPCYGAAPVKLDLDMERLARFAKRPEGGR